MTATTHPGRRLAWVLHSEWTKFRSLRSTYWTLIVSVVITIGLGIVLLVTGALHRYDRMTLAEQASYRPVDTGAWYHGLELGQIMFAVLGVLVATGEYGTGTIRATLAAVPRRGRVFAAKTAGYAVVCLIAGGLLAFTMFAVAQPTLARRQLDVPLWNPAALRGVALAAVATMGVGLLGLALGLIVRHTAAAVAAVTVLMLGVGALASSLAPDWAAARYTPPLTDWAILTPDGDLLTQGPATAVFLGYVTALLAIAGVVFGRRDS